MKTTQNTQYAKHNFWDGAIWRPMRLFGIYFPNSGRWIIYTLLAGLVINVLYGALSTETWKDFLEYLQGGKLYLYCISLVSASIGYLTEQKDTKFSLYKNWITNIGTATIIFLTFFLFKVKCLVFQIFICLFSIAYAIYCRGISFLDEENNSDVTDDAFENKTRKKLAKLPRLQKTPDGMTV
ncbi:MAG: hypothetical protein MJY97_00105 [Bacteroidales bacterium]|nr:hypothetical protein [Bacteroidales bacterium]